MDKLPSKFKQNLNPDEWNARWVRATKSNGYGRDLEGDLQEEAKGIYLAFSLINLHGPKAQKNQSKSS